MRGIAAFALVLGLFNFASPAYLSASILPASGAVTLRGTGLGPDNGVAVPERQTYSQQFPPSAELIGSRDVESYAFGFGGVPIRYDSAASWRAVDGALGVLAYAYAEAVLNVLFDQGQNRNLQSVQYTTRNDLADRIVEDVFTASVTFDQSGTADVRYWTQAVAVSNAGFAQVYALDTIKLQNITFADGTTPESHGYTVLFESGLRSPNLGDSGTVPEPASLAIWGGVGIAGLIASRRRQKAMAAKT